MNRAWTGSALAAAALTALALLPTPAASAQDFGGMGMDEGGPKVTVGEISIDREAVPAGLPTTVRIPLSIRPAWHIYAVDEKAGQPTSIAVAEWPEGVSAGTVTISPEAHEYTTGTTTQMVHDGDVTLSLQLVIAADAAPGPRTLNGVIHWLACDDRSCDPPAEHEFSVSFEVGAPPKARLIDVSFAEPSVAPGGTAKLRLTVEMDDEWHIYGLEEEFSGPTRIEVDSWPDGLSRGELSESPKAHDYEAFEDMFQKVHEKQVTFTLDVKVDPAAALGPRTVTGQVVWMTCDASVCLPEDTVPFTVALDVGEGGAAAGGAAEGDGGDGGAETAAATTAAETPPEKQGESKGVTLDLILQAIFLGFITVLTPCVFPMLPITVSFFAKQEGPALPRSLVYGAGWIFTIVGIGLVFKSTLDIFARGDLFNLAVGLLFLVLALSLFGMFDLRLPSFLSNWSSQKSSAGGYVGAFFMAVTIALTSFSCSVPFLAIMFEQFEAGEFTVAIVGLTVYAMTLAAPFVLCSLFPAMLKTMPSAGSWMNAIKVTMGFVEFGLAFKFLRTVDLNNEWGFLTRDFLIALWIACAVGAALYLFGYLVLPHDTKPESIGVVRMCFAVMFLTFGVYLVPPLFGKPLPPALEGFIQGTAEEQWLSAGGGHSGNGTSEDVHLAWVLNDWDGSLQRGVERNTPVLFDFTGVG